MDQDKVDWINKLTGTSGNPGAAALRENEKKKWDARDEALTQIRSKIADNRDRLKKDMDISVHRDGIALEYNENGEIVKKKVTSKKDEADRKIGLDDKTRDQTKEYDWDDQFDFWSLMTDEDLVKHADASKLINTLVMELESATVEIGGTMVPLFDKEDIADEFYTPLVREGLMAETFVPNDYSRTHEMIQASFNDYKERLEEEGFSDMTYMGEMAQLGLSLASSAALAISTVPVVMDATVLIGDSKSVKWSNFVPAIEDSSWMSNKGTSNFTEISDILSKGMDLLDDGVEVGNDFKEKYKDPKTPVEPLDRRRLMADRIANSLVSGVSGVVSVSMNTNGWNMGLTASTTYRSNANLKGITTLLQNTTSPLEDDHGDQIVGFLKAGFAKIFEVIPTPIASGAGTAIAKISTVFATCNGSDIARLINEEKYPDAVTLVTDAAGTAMNPLAWGDLCTEITNKAAAITQALGNEMAKELTKQFAETDKILSADREKINQDMDAKDRAPLIEKQIAELERSELQLKLFSTVMSQGAAFASKFFAPLVMAGSAISLMVNTKKCYQRWTDAQNFLESQGDMLRDASPFSAPIQNFVLNANFQKMHYLRQSVCDGLSLIGAMVETACYLTGPSAAIGVVVGQMTQAAVGAASSLESAMYEIQKNNNAREGWNSYKEALRRPENRRLALLAMKANPTLTKYAIAWGAIIEKDPLVADFATKTGLTPESLADTKDIGMVVKYLETKFSDDNVIVGREAVGKGWAPAPALTLECWNAAIRRGANEANLLVGGDYEKPIDNVEYSILACIEPWKQFEALPVPISPPDASAKAVVEANLSALQTLINALGYSPKRSEGGKTIEHLQMREFLGSMRGLAEIRVNDIKVKYQVV